MKRGLPTFLFILLAGGTLAFGAWWLGRAGAHGSDTPLSASRPIPAAGWGPMRVMTANVRLDEPADKENGWIKRRELLAKTLLKHQPEIIGCQELSPAQGAYLSKELSLWYSYYPGGATPTATAAVQTRSAAAEFFGAIGESLASLNTIYFRNDRFELAEGESGLVLPKEPQVNVTENTFFSLAVLREKRAPGTKPATLIIVDAHLRHGEPFAIRCAEELRRKIGTWLTKYPASGIVLLGDINRGRGTSLYGTLMAETPAETILIDTFDYTKPPGPIPNGTYHAFTGKPNAATPTDLIFSGGTLLMKSPAQILRDHTPEGRYPSDHYFIQTELDWH